MLAVSRFLPARREWPLIAGVAAAPLALGGLVSVEATFILPIGLIYASLAIGVVLVQLVSGAVHLVRRRWSGAARSGAIILVVATFLPLLQLGEMAGYFGRFAVSYPHYAREVARLRRPDRPLFVLWQWNGYLIFNTIYLAYDERESLAQASRSAASRQLADQLSGGTLGSAFDAYRLGGHYFIVTTF